MASFFYTMINRSLADCVRNRTKIPDSIFMLSLSSRLFFDRRDQFSASAIQKTWLAGSRCASSLHSAARESSSD
jgi:hypothetical protein